MIVYIDRVPRYKFPKRISFRGMLWPRLEGVNIVGDENGFEVVPVYVPFARISPGDGQLLIELAMWSHNAWIIFLFNRWPFIYIERGGGTDLESREIDED